MSMTYIRVLIYMVLPFIGTLPGFQYVSEAGQLVINIDQALPGIGAGIVAGYAILWKWGKK